LRDRYQEFEEEGAEIVAIGMGTPDKAARFRKTRSIPFPLLADKDRQSYAAAGLRKGTAAGVIGPRVWATGVKGLAKGRGVALPRENPAQLGGTVVVHPGGRITHHHVAETSADNAPIESLLEAIRA
jgi:peroxiredoxin